MEPKWVGDIPDGPPPPGAIYPFIMLPEGHARLFGLGMAEGPFPEHYEPFETPLGVNPMHPNNPKVVSNPYGTTSPMLNAGSGTVPLYVQFTPSGFVPSTTYHYRLVASNSEGITYGQDAMFTTSGKLQKLPIGILHLLLGK